MQPRTKLLAVLALIIGIFSTLAFAQPSVNSVDHNVSNVIQAATPMPSPLPEEAIPSGPPLSLTISLLCFCFALSLVIGVFVLGIIVRRPGPNDRERNKEKEDHGI